MAEKKIQNHVVRFDRLPGDLALTLLFRFLKLLAPLQGVLRLTMASDAVDREEALQVAMAAALERMDDAAIVALMTELACSCRIDGIAVTEATIGVMGLEELIEVALFAAETEFGPTLRRYADAGSRAGVVIGARAA